MIVLASQSASRRALLSAAQVPFEALSPGVDEEAAKEALRADGLDARALADALAELKARKVSRRVPGAQLFAKVEGSQVAIQGLPLLPLLDFLRVRGVLAA